ncbi:MAG: contact-dependent growth inhibition system immunity protein [Acidobacteriota bacterium]|nr:contact-dependent growth inhibition system immunity protein [Acidobacteriota bacterium]
MNFEKEFYELDQLLGGYFHQSWQSAFFWGKEAREPKWEVAIRQYLFEDSEEGIRKTRKQLETLLSLNLSEDELEKIIDNATGSGYKPLHTHRAFLNRILEILKEPRPKKELLVRK